MASTVHVENISTKTSEDEIKSFFSFCGKIQNISVTPVDADTQSASVTFEKTAAAKTALLLDSTQLGSNSVLVRSAQSLDDLAKDELSSTGETTKDGHHIEQEHKPRARIFAEYLAHGYVISDKAIESALATDKQNGYSTKFLNTLQTFDNKAQVTQKAQVVDQKLGLTEKALAGWAGLTSYYDKAASTPTGQKLRAFYEQGNKTVMDVHNEARHLADLKKQQAGGKPTAAQANVHEVDQSGNTQCSCNAQAGKCPCPEDKCACNGCGKAQSSGVPSVEQANVHQVDASGKTQCNCGAQSGKCPCPEGKCACDGCEKAVGTASYAGAAAPTS